MNLFSIEFFAFFLIVFFIYYKINVAYQHFVLFFASSVFILFFSPVILVYTYAFVLYNYLISRALAKFHQYSWQRKLLFNSGIILNISLLVFFKYFNFLIDSGNQFLQFFRVHISFETLKLVIPLGISYYTFQGISYLLQIYRGIEKPERNLLVVANYFLFFPKFLSGPIELSRKFIPQLKKAYYFNHEEFIDGLRLILWGAFKKMVIADRLAILVDGVYPQLHQLNGNILFITFLLQPLQIYCDFSGYTDIALGIGRAFGLKLTENFYRPFFSTSVTVFWQRWHISLSSWCNEFIFKRISFKRRKWGNWAVVYAAFVTFFIIGLWHGPNWTFIVLGLIQAIAITYEYLTKKYRVALIRKLPSKLALYLSYLITYVFVCFTILFFYSPNLADPFYFVGHMFSQLNFSNLDLFLLSKSDKIIVLISLITLFIVEFRQENGKNIWKEIELWPRWTRVVTYYAICVFTIYFGTPIKEFVYMKF